MSIEKNSSLEWEDIENLYKNLNTALDIFLIKNIDIPENPNIALTSAISNLQSVINASITSNAYLKNEVTQNVVSIPNKNDIIKVLEFQSLKETIDKMHEVCPENTSGHNAVCVDHVTYTRCVNHESSGGDECSRGITTYSGGCLTETPTNTSCNTNSPTNTNCNTEAPTHSYCITNCPKQAPTNQSGVTVDPW